MLMSRAASKPHRAAPARFGVALFLQQRDERTRVLETSQDFRLAADNREVAGSEDPHAREFRWGFQFEEQLECPPRLLGRQVAQLDLEDEPAEARGIERLGEVGGAGEGERMALHPGEHLVHLAHFPAPHGALTVAQQGVGLVKDEERLLVESLLKRTGDPLL